MATRNQSGKGTAAAAVSDTFRSLDFGKLVESIGSTLEAQPKLFPDGINKLELEFGSEKVRCLIEGPSSTPKDESALRTATPFEFQFVPESLVTSASPVAGTAADQQKLTAGQTIEGAAKVFNRDCLGKVSSYQNNCAHYLSDAFIEAGFSELAVAHSCVSSGGRCGPPHCTSGGKRPIRARDVRCWFNEKDANPDSTVGKGTGHYAVYQERQSDGQGHVVILDSDNWKYYGTGWYEAGQPAPNDWKHWYYQWG